MAEGVQGASAGALAGVELVLVAYRSRDHVAQLLAGLPEDVALVTVDNSDGADGLADLVRARRGGRYLSGGGIGFARAANLGARTSTSQVLVFVKPSTRPTTADLAALVADVRADPRCSASAGTLVGADGQVQLGNGGWEPSVARAAVHSFGLHKLRPQAGLYARPALHAPARLDWVNGGCMAVRRETFLELGCFDEDFYLFNEDVAFGRSSREHGYTQRLRTDIPVYGAEGGSGAPSLEMWRLRGASMNRYLAKHSSPAGAAGIAALLGAGSAARTVARAVRRNPTGARQSWAYTAGLFSGRGEMNGAVVMSRAAG